MDDRLLQGIQAYRCGNRTGAAHVFSELLRENPDDELAWLWLSVCVDDPGRREFCLKKVEELRSQGAPAPSTPTPTALPHFSKKSAFLLREVLPVALVVVIVVVVGHYFLPWNSLDDLPVLAPRLKYLPSAIEPVSVDGLQPMTPQNASHIHLLERGGEGKITALTWFPDSESIAVATSTGILLRSGSKLEKAQRITNIGVARQIAFSSNGRRLAFSAEGNVVIWEIGAYQPKLVQDGKDATFSSDAQKVALRSAKGVAIYNFYTSEPLVTYQFKSENVSSAQFWPNGRFVIAEWGKEKLTVVDIVTGTPVLTLDQNLKELGRVTLAAISPDGRYLSWVNDSLKITLYDLKAEQIAWQKEWGSAPESLWFTDSGNQVWVGNDLGLGGFDLQGNLSSVALGRDCKPPFAVSSDGARFACVNNDTDLKIMILDKSVQETAPIWPQPLVFSPPVLLRPDGKLVAAPDPAWRTVTGYAFDGKSTITYAGDDLAADNDISAYTFSPDARWIALARKQSVRLLPAQSATLRSYRDLPYPEAGFSGRALQYSYNGQHLAAWGNTLVVWDVGAGKIVQNFDPHSDGADVVLRPSHTLTQVAVGLRGGQVRVAAVDGSGSALQLSGHTQPIAALAFSNDDRLLASVAQGDPLVKVWDAHSGQLLTTLTSNAPRQMIFSAYGKLLFVGQEDGVIQVWEVGSGKLLASLNGHSGAITSLDISLDGSLLVSSGEDATLRFWGVKP